MGFQLYTAFVGRWRSCRRAKSSCFCLLTARMSWQYALPQNVHPSIVQQRRTVLKFNLYPSKTSKTYSWLAVVSSSLLISTVLVSSVITVFLPLPVAKQWFLKHFIYTIEIKRWFTCLAISLYKLCHTPARGRNPFVIQYS